jgi:hypothetical protein
MRSIARTSLALAGLWASAAAAQQAPEGPAPPRTWYAQAMAYGDGGINVTHFWSKGARMRAETVIAGHKVVTIVNGATYYAYDGLEGRGVAIQRTPTAISADSDERRPFGRELDTLVRQGAERVSETEFQGVPIAIYRLTDQLGRREVWINRAGEQLPVRAVVYLRSASRTSTTDYLNWLSNLPIGDSFFEPEPGVHLERYGFAEYMERLAKLGPVGPVPVLYADLLHGNQRGSE